MTRRELLQLAASLPLLDGSLRAATQDRGLSLERFRSAPWRATAADGSPAPDTVQLTRTWADGICRSELANAGRQPVALKAVTLFDLEHDLPDTTPLYGEGFQMLSQTGGTLGTIADLGNYTDAGHYKMVEPAGARVVYNLLTLDGGAQHHVLAFTSCRRFSGHFALSPGTIRVTLDLEGLTLGPGERWPLEEFSLSSGTDREALLDGVASRLAAHHKPLAFRAPPSGWCSWYCFGPKVTARQVLDNLEVIARDIPGLRYIQIDDGYQPAMGDWLETGTAFGGAVQTVLRQIRDRGFEPAIWVAPFIAEEGSTLFTQHPDWFVKDSTGAPLRADRVTFGGWRRGPWYALDGTHPEAQAHLERVFRTMRDEWGCTYFKLDANFWGAIHGGRFHDRARISDRGVPPWNGGGAARHARRVRARLQPSHLAVDRRHSRLAQFARHPARLEAHQRHGATEPESQLAERAALVERSGRDRADRSAERRRVPVSRHHDLRQRWDDPVRRRPHHDHSRRGWRC